jgi:hypothetical protein
MAFFSLGKKIQVLLIAGSMAAASACYESGGRRGDVSEDDVTAVDPRVDEIIFSEDPPAYPQCTTFDSTALSVTQVEAAQTHVVGNVELVYSGYIVCSPVGQCLRATLNGSGSVASVEQLDNHNARFRYENDAFPYWEVVDVDLTWSLTCRDEAWRTMTREITVTAYICRDEVTGDLMIKTSPAECPTVVDCPPPPIPISMLDRSERIGLSGRQMADGSVLLILTGLSDAAVEVQWEASEGSLQVLSKDRAVFVPSSGSPVQVVQASIVGPKGVVVELYRHRKS